MSDPMSKSEFMAKWDRLSTDHIKNTLVDKATRLHCECLRPGMSNRHYSESRQNYLGVLDDYENYLRLFFEAIGINNADIEYARSKGWIG